MARQLQLALYGDSLLLAALEAALAARAEIVTWRLDASGGRLRRPDLLLVDHAARSAPVVSHLLQRHPGVPLLVLTAPPGHGDWPES